MEFLDVSAVQVRLENKDLSMASVYECLQIDFYEALSKGPVCTLAAALPDMWRF